MELGFDAKRLFCNFTGLGNYSRTLLRNLVEYFPEHTYHLYTPTNFRNEATGWFSDHPLFKIHTPKKSGKLFWRSYFVVKQLQKNNPALYHGLSHELPFGINKTGIKTVVTIHDLIFRHYPETYPIIDRIVYDAKFKHACRTADKIIAISNSTKKDIIKYYNIEPSKIDVIYQACNPLYYSLQSEADVSAVRKKYSLPTDYILYVGSIEKRKNLQIVLQALAQLPNDLRLPLVVVGKGKTYKQDCVNLAVKLGISNQVYWFNNLESNSDLQAFYQAAQVLVYPSLSEGFGLPVAEALLSNTPVITSNISSMPEAGGPDSLFIDPGNPEELKESLIRALTDTNLTIRMKKHGREYAMKNFSPAVVSKKVMDLYLQVGLDK